MITASHADADVLGAQLVADVLTVGESVDDEPSQPARDEQGKDRDGERRVEPFPNGRVHGAVCWGDNPVPAPKNKNVCFPAAAGVTSRRDRCMKKPPVILASASRAGWICSANSSATSRSSPVTLPSA